MVKPRYNFGKDYTGFTRGLQIEGEWAIDVDKSSQIELLPSTGIIKKQKTRTLKKTVYEVFATLFLSSLLKNYNRIFNADDFALYCPEAIRFQYGEFGRDDSLDSLIYEFFCPGIPLRQVKSSRRIDFQVEEEPVRIEKRIMYLAGIITEILSREGIAHGDPQLRHFLLLPEEGYLANISQQGNIYFSPSRNGLGVIDVENLRSEGRYSEAVLKEAALFKERLMTQFSLVQGKEEYYEKGKSIVRAKCDAELSLAELSYQEAFASLSQRFSGLDVKRIDLEKQEISYKG